MAVRRMRTVAATKAGGLWEFVKTVVIAVVIAVFIRTFAYEPFNIPSGSMIPTLLVGDYLFVSKLSYGYSRYSLPLSPPIFPGRILFTEPERGDVAVFKKPGDTGTDFIKRIVGLPGDTIQVRRGILHINGAAVKRDRAADYIHTDGFGRKLRVPQFVETLPNGRRHMIIEAMGDGGFTDDTPPLTVPAGHYFMMGDNRDNSVDSRTREVGFVPRQNLVGRAEILFFSTDGTADAWEVWKWPFATRFSRIFQTIE